MLVGLIEADQHVQAAKRTNTPLADYYKDAREGDSARPHRQGGGVRQPRLLPGVGCRLLHHRHRDQRRRRPLAGGVNGRTLPARPAVRPGCRSRSPAAPDGVGGGRAVALHQPDPAAPVMRGHKAVGRQSGGADRDANTPRSGRRAPARTTVSRAPRRARASWARCRDRQRAFDLSSAADCRAGSAGRTSRSTALRSDDVACAAGCAVFDAIAPSGVVRGEPVRHGARAARRPRGVDRQFERRAVERSSATVERVRRVVGGFADRGLGRGGS